MRRALAFVLVAGALIGTAHAQDIGAILGAAALPPPSLPPPPAAFTFFTDLFQAVDGTIQDAAAPIVATAVDYATVILKLALMLWLACFCVGHLFPTGSGGSMFFGGLFRELFAGAVALSALTIYAGQILPFLLDTLPGELAAVFTFGGSPRAGATVAGNFDAIWNVTTDLANLVGDRIPDALSLSAIKLMAELSIMKFAGDVFIWWGFIVFAAVHMVQIILVIIGVLFVAMAPIPAARKYAWSWLSALLATICTTTVLALILGLMLGVVTKQYQFLAGLPETTAYASQADGFAKVVGALFMLGTLMTIAPLVGIGIFGGIHSTTNAVSATVGAAGSAVAAGGRRLVGAT